MKLILVACFLLVLHLNFKGQNTTIYPSNWWVGMKMNKIQLLIHSANITEGNPKAQINYSGIKILKTQTATSKNYVMLDIEIAPNAKVGTAIITIKYGSSVSYIPFELKARRKGNGTLFAQGVTNKDLMYLIMPDRFCNGDVSNDKVPGMLDQTLNRDTVFNRHGGDLKGIESKLDYLNNLGVTSIWLTPVQENNMPDRTEHGYAITDHYTIDPRHGGDAAYHSFIEATHKKGMKVIQDAVYNHIGIEHILFKDKPAEDWFHVWPKYTGTTYKDQTIFDPYGTNYDKKKMVDGWFTPQMTDWNQYNPMVCNFLIQHAIWSVENFGFDGWRLDTYAYNDLPFMNRCNAALYAEYPKMTLFGETWVHGMVNQAYFCQNNLDIPFKSNLQATTDFQTLLYGIQPALTQDFGWTEGVNKLYSTLASDIIYKDPTRQVNFLDNHDMPRFYSVLNKDLNKYKTAFAWLLTCRGIPQMYYGNEILMEGFTNPDGNVRKDFMGGWSEDAKNKFTKEGRNDQENEMVDYISGLANFRKKSSALTTGKFKQYLPIDGMYIYARYDAKQTVLCIMNTSKETKTINFADYKEVIEKFKGGQIVNNKFKPIIFNSEYKLNSYEMIVIDCK